MGQIRFIFVIFSIQLQIKYKIWLSKMVCLGYSQISTIVIEASTDAKYVQLQWHKLQ